MGMGSKAKYHVHDLPKEDRNRSSKRQELPAGQAEEEEVYSGGGVRCLHWLFQGVGDMMGKAVPSAGMAGGKACREKPRGWAGMRSTRLGRASKAMFMGWSVFHKQ